MVQVKRICETFASNCSRRGRLAYSRRANYIESHNSYDSAASNRGSTGQALPEHRLDRESRLRIAVRSPSKIYLRHSSCGSDRG